MLRVLKQLVNKNENGLVKLKVQINKLLEFGLFFYYFIRVEEVEGSCWLGSCKHLSFENIIENREGLRKKRQETIL
jgi:hypothetical protein